MDDGFRFDSLAVRAEQQIPNPLAQLEARLGALEASGLAGRGAWGVAFGSGRAALDAVARLLRPQDKLVLHFESSSLAVRAFSALAEWDIEIEFNDLTDPEVSFDGVSAVYVENPSLATLTSLQLSNLASKAHQAGAILLVENSLLTAFACRPLEFAADAVIYSSAAALTGDYTLAFGAVLGRSEELLERIRGHRDTVGSRPNAQVCGSALRGLKTLSVRQEKQSNTTQLLLTKLEGHAALTGIAYPSSEAHQTRDGREFNGACIALEFAVPEAAKTFIDKLRYFETSDWYGSTDSAACQVGRTSHRALENLNLGIPETVVRISIGLEDPQDLWRSLENALEAALEVTPEPEPLEPDEPDGEPNAPLAALEDPTRALDNAALKRFVTLRIWRDQQAIEQNTSRFLIASNAILAEIAKQQPNNVETLATIKGIGQKKLERYGHAILELLKKPEINWLEQLPALEVSMPKEKPNAIPVNPNFDPKRKRRRKKKPNVK